MWVLPVLALLTALCIGAAQEPDEADDAETHLPPTAPIYSGDECRIWLAPSTVEGAGLGMFAGVDFDEGQDFFVEGDSVIAIVDFYQHNADKTPVTAFHWFEYTWTGSAMAMHNEGYQAVQVASEGFGAAINCFMDLVNVKEWNPQLTDVGLHRSKDPGAGASTYYHQRRSTAKRPLVAGAELFASYGENYFKDRTAKLGPIPLNGDLERATRLLQKFSVLQSKLQRAYGDDANAMWQDVWNVFVKGTKFTESRVLLGSFKHDDPDDLNIIQRGHANNVTKARIAGSQRSVNWLQEHGTCVDYITGLPSTLPQAGMGAFATRTLPEGTAVAQLPLIHISDRGSLEMFHLQKNADGQMVPASNKKVTGHQLLLNYCFGHRDSTMLLCPYGPMVNYVNHNQTRANVRLQWGRARKSNHMPGLLNESLETITNLGLDAKLNLEIVATREIAQGEEVLLDYGDEWEAAWHEYVARWSPVKGSNKYKSAGQLNTDTKSRLRSVFEGDQGQTLPDNVFLLCDSKCHTNAKEVRKHHLAGTLARYLKLEYAQLWHCHVLRSRLDDETDDYLYTIHMFQNDTGVPTSSILVKDVPRGIFRFVDKPGTSDTYLPYAFRHDLRIPDSLFPLPWRNKPS